MFPTSRFALTAFLLASSAHAAPATLARFAFDPAAKQIIETVSGDRITPAGSFVASESPRGPAIRLDGDTTSLSGKAVPRLLDGGAWTISAWLRLDALPWNDAPILDQKTSEGSVFFGVDPWGHLIAQRATAGAKAGRIISQERLAPRAWALVILSYRNGAMTLGINGVPAHASPADPAPDQLSGAVTPLLIGRLRTPALPFPSNAIHPILPVYFSLEGSIGDLAIYDQALSAAETRRLMTGIKPAQLAPAPAPPLPHWQGGAGPFGAFKTSLAYDASWDKPRRVGPDADVVVRFPQAPIQLVFWQGANYIPAWVTENGRWYSDEFMEIYGKPRCPDGEDCEPMSDKQVRYSHVEILESTPARAVVHWRYALSEVENARLADAPDPSAWGAWADEYWTIYPDGGAVRRQVLWTDNPGREASEFQESIIIIPAGQTPEDNLNLDALSLANLKGEAKSFTWPQRTATDFAKPRGADHFTGLDDPMIQWVNLKSDWKPFQVASGGPAKFEGINWEPSMSSFEWWNHWPVAQIRSSGRPALTSDRPSHTSISHIAWPVWEKTDQTISRVLMTGLTTGSAASLAPRARSWLSPAPAALRGAGGTISYDQTQRAYVIKGRTASGSIEVELDADSQHPLVNPAFVIEGWQGGANAALSNDSGAIRADVQIGQVLRLEGSSLIVYVPLEATGRTRLTLSPGPRQP